MKFIQLEATIMVNWVQEVNSNQKVMLMDLQKLILILKIMKKKKKLKLKKFQVYLQEFLFKLKTKKKENKKIIVGDLVKKGIKL